MAPQLTSAYFHSQALMTLFVMYSQDGWANIMYDGLDAVAEDIEVPVISPGNKQKHVEVQLQL